MTVESRNVGMGNGQHTSKHPGNAAASRRGPKARVYINGGIMSLSTSFARVLSKVKRHDALIHLSSRGESFEVETEGFHGLTSAIAIPPAQSFSIHGRAMGLVDLYVHLIHPRFRTVRNHLAGQPKLLSRNRFAHLDERLHGACTGNISAHGACELMEDILDVVLADAPRAPPIDLRVPWIMRKLDMNIDHPFEELAAELGLSTSRLSHLFSKELGVPFRSYQSWARVRQAWEMLVLQPDMHVTEVAHCLGFADVAHLSRSFHATLGFVPSVLRDPRAVEVIALNLVPGHHIPSDEQMVNA